MPESLLPFDAAIEMRVDCHERSSLQTKIKGVDIFSSENNIALSQMAYLDTKGENTTESIQATKLDTRGLNDEEHTQHRTAAGRLARVVTGASPTSACFVSVAFQGKQKNLALLKGCRKAYANIDAGTLEFLPYVQLKLATIHISVFFDSSFQNLPDNHSQLGFIFFLADENNRSSIFHCHKSRATRLPASTEEAKVLALDVALPRLCNLRRIIFQLRQKEVLVVLYIDNQSLWQNLMNKTAPSMPEVMFRCRERIFYEVASRIGLNKSALNPADVTAKKNPNWHCARTFRRTSNAYQAKRFPCYKTAFTAIVTLSPSVPSQ